MCVGGETYHRSARQNETTEVYRWVPEVLFERVLCPSRRNPTRSVENLKSHWTEVSPWFYWDVVSQSKVRSHVRSVLASNDVQLLQHPQKVLWKEIEDTSVQCSERVQQHDPVYRDFVLTWCIHTPHPLVHTIHCTWCRMLCESRMPRLHRSRTRSDVSCSRNLRFRHVFHEWFHEILNRVYLMLIILALSLTLGSLSCCTLFQ